ncbi:SufE family protein [Aureimonas mangrovi]|uniref:SufE family protein n=1 Tax=Aureimonas mangrovi TaxID=2758041 RepID=UPI00163DA637|nr:SufE family protein [Aureimonas mangrovi]
MPNFQDIADNFEFLPEENDKLEYIIELGKLHAALPEEQRTEANEVHGCQSRVWIASRPDPSDPSRLLFSGTSDSFIVRGLVALAILLFSERTASEIKALDAETIFTDLGLQAYLTSKRSNGLRSVIARMKGDAEQVLAAG